MERATSPLAMSVDDPAEPASVEPGSVHFQRPSIEEISLSCEISAYAPDTDDRPLF